MVFEGGLRADPSAVTGQKLGRVLTGRNHDLNGVVRAV
jgi:hypothetical protein